MDEEGEGPLARWSRLKRRSRSAGSGRRGGAAPVTVANVDPGFPAASVPGGTRGVSPRLRDGGDAPAAPEGGVPAVAPGEDTPAGEDAAKDLPPIDGLGKDSDYTPFLGEGVPEKLARAAMRKLWRSDPIFAFRDGLDDYDEDFTIIETIVKAVTSKAGKAKAKAKKARARKAKAEAKAKKTKAEAKARKAKAEAKAKKTKAEAKAKKAKAKAG
ncbi:MAG: DUF3306 domain-containing protein, partial [Proteobacteria bacterium]|nr:DUF3306 domain-containing protein [Pseudomonadota bacterium]